MRGHFSSCTAQHNCWCEAKRLLQLLGVTLCIFTIEIVAGIAIGSLSLTADAFHVLADNAVFLVALFTVILIRLWRHQNPEKILGWAFYGSNALLAITMALVIFEAIGRIIAPSEVTSGFLMAVVATIGMCGNWWQHHIHEKAPDEHRHALHHSISVHIISDLALSGAVCVGGIIIALTEITRIDPIISIGVALWTFKKIWDMLREHNGESKHTHHHEH